LQGKYLYVMIHLLWGLYLSTEVVDHMSKTGTLSSKSFVELVTCILHMVHAAFVILPHFCIDSS